VARHVVLIGRPVSIVAPDRAALGLNFGFLLGAGDVDGDGFGDLAIGSFNAVALYGPGLLGILLLDFFGIIY